VAGDVRVNEAATVEILDGRGNLLHYEDRLDYRQLFVLEFDEFLMLDIFFSITLKESVNTLQNLEKKYNILLVHWNLNFVGIRTQDFLI
jgi:hypothetical protein